jgi:hypothetical protein
VSLRLEQHFLQEVNGSINYERLPAVEPILKFKCREFVNEGEESKETTRFLMAATSIGCNAPRAGYPRKQFCPICPLRIWLSKVHLFTCQGLERSRQETGLNSFMNMNQLMGHDGTMAFSRYINGLTVTGGWVDNEERRSRGKALIKLVEDYKRQW